MKKIARLARSDFAPGAREKFENQNQKL